MNEDVRRLALAVYLPSVIFSFADGLLIPTLPLFAASFEVSLWVVGVALAGEAIGMLLADAPVGWLLRKMPQKSAMLLGGGLTALAALATAAAPNLALIIVLRVLSGMGLALFGIARHAYLAQATRGGRRGRTIAIYGGVNRLGVFVGPAVGGAVAMLLGLRAPFVLYAVLAVCALLLVMRFLPREVASGRQLGRLRARRALRVAGPVLVNAGLGQVLGQTARAGRKVLIPLFASQVLGLGALDVGLIVSLSGLVDMAMFYPAGLLMDTRGRKHAIVPCFVIMALGMLVVPFTTGFASLLGAALLIGLGNGLGSGTMMTLGADLAPDAATGEFLGLWRMIGDAGMVSGPLLVGAVAQFTTLGISAGAVALVSAAAAGWFAFRVPETLRR
ncbi:MAG TPA: MFS transporter [Trueperaceae bacterium]|nr:MFS transporter [Trueperaceae bacterium]